MSEKNKEELANMYKEEFAQKRAIFKAGLNDEQRKFIIEVESKTYAGKSSYYKAFFNGLSNGKYKRPSDFVNDKLDWIFDGYIYRRFKAALCYALDHSRDWAYSTSYYRRSFRSSQYYMDRLLGIMYEFHSQMNIDKDVCDILNLNLNDMEKACFLSRNDWRPCGCSEMGIAYELDMNNSLVESAVEEIIMGDSEVPMQNFIIRGIVKSNNVKMHELLGKLLLAAKLQEGLRQNICENMDIGTIPAFKSILKVIVDNNLIRFSSVKRAVGTWLGLIEPDSRALERISDKSIELIVRCIEDRQCAEEFINTEDCMKIYIGLWSIAVYNTIEAIEVVKKLSENGTHHQVLTSGYFCANLDNTELAGNLAKAVIADHKDEQDILAVYMPHFLAFGSFFVKRQLKDILKEKDYFDNKEEAEKYYDIMLHIYEGISGKNVEFSPCIFPWYSASLKKTYVIEKLCYIAAYLEDSDKTDYVCDLLKECDADNRSTCLFVLLDNPKTSKQKAVATQMLCDKESYTRRTAASIVESMKKEDSNYLQMEDMLRYKAADMRSVLIEFLYKQEDDKLAGTIERLLEDSKEEKRTAGLDMVMRLSKDVKRSGLYENVLPLVNNISAPTSKEKVLINNILGCDTEDNQETKILFDKSDKYIPKFLETEFYDNAVDVFMRYFPDSKLKEQLLLNTEKKSVLGVIKDKFTKPSSECAQLTKKDCDSLYKLFAQHASDEYRGYGGETYTFASKIGYFREVIDGKDNEIPGLAIWKEWYENNIGAPERLYRMYILLKARSMGVDFDDAIRPYIIQIFGSGFQIMHTYQYKEYMLKIVLRLINEYCSKADKLAIAVAAGYWYVKCLPQDKVLIKSIPPLNMISYCREREAHFITHSQLCGILGEINCKSGECFKGVFPLAVMIAEKTFMRDVKMAEENPSVIYYRERRHLVSPRSYDYADGLFSEPGVVPYILAVHYGILSKNALYEYIFRPDNIGNAIETITLIASGLREQGRKVTKRGHFSWFNRRQELLMEEFKDDVQLRELVDEVYENVVNEVLSKELKRGDSETVYSKIIHNVKRIYGIDNLIAILVALGKDTLERSSYYSGDSKKANMSRLLSVCIPLADDNADKLRNALAKTDITDKKLIEAALYSPEWIDIVGEYLGIEGFKSACYYFMAHMNERFDDKRKAIIAKFTPLSEEELNDGAFDINWFKNAYETVGKKQFDIVYDAAKYISDGAKHSRARKYADATLGIMEVDDTENKITDKRNKDLVMAYSLIPVSNEDDIIRRYLFLQNFLKESKKFGSQRIASEKKAVEIAMSNLAMNAGYSDVTRLTLRMETKLIDDIRELFEDKEIEDVILRLNVSDEGKAEIIRQKAGKVLKSVPAKLKKHEYVVRLTESKKKLTEQFKRTKIMFEQAMEEETQFTVEEIKVLHKNPVANAVVKNLVFKSGDSLGFLVGNKLVDYNGSEILLSDGDKVLVAHPYRIYKDGHWADYQKNLFDNKITQVFKQVFRELYVKTDEELELNYSRRYSGNQIQPKKTVACLKGRRWVADIEDGLQKVYYKENIVARIYAMADWFTPSDIEAPTLELVEFSDRRTGMQIKIKDIPDVVFSEVMRDVDLAVSVAHAGGVDPETSHSTVEMRAALLTFTLPLFKLDNVKINKNHAIVEGSYGTYDINLGSGVIHKRGGTMITVLPVHSQHRGKIFLPFADDDPKTAEIITKVIMFAQDKKIKDVNILEQIR